MKAKIPSPCVKKERKRNPRRANLLRWLLMLPFGFAAFVFTFLLRGYSFSALVCCAIIGVLLFYNLMNILERRHSGPVRVLRRIFTVCLCIGLVVAGITECFIIEASFGDPEKDCDYIIVLGAKVREDGPSVSLQNRIDAAYDYLTAHPDVIAIVSGGQGPDEPMTEARCMYEHLVAMGIDESRIWMEDEAASTYANLQYALNLVEEKTGVRPQTLGILSSEYHLFRAGMQARDCGVEPIGIPARTSRFSQAVNHFMREIAGVWHYFIFGGQYD